jgi:acyl-CoA thioesterase-2
VSLVTATPIPARAEVPLDDLLAVAPMAGAPGRFVGCGRDYGILRVYGGHLLGQALAAAFETVDAPKLAHALSAQFLRTGEPGVPIEYAVEPLRDSRSFATRAVRAAQGAELLFTMTASFKQSEPGAEHQPEAPHVPSAAELQRARLARGEGAFPFPFIAGLDVELEIVDGWNPRADALGPPRIQSWLRAPAPAPRSARADQCAFAFLSDSTLMFNALRPHGAVGRTHRATSLDHHVWFHRPHALADWLLLDQDSSAAADSRGLNHARAFDAAGRLVASVAQESMLRAIG